MIRRLLNLIGHQPYPDDRPYLWVIGRQWSALYPRVGKPVWFVGIHPRARYCRARLLLGWIAIYCDRNRDDVWARR